MTTPSTPASFTIRLEPSGRSFQCAANVDILKAGLASDVSLRYSCRSGVCRTCRSRVLQGRVDLGAVHPAYLSEADRAEGHAHLCCARPLSDCVIEADEIPAGLLPAQQLPSRIMLMEKLAPDVMRVVLGFPPNEAQKFSAGQYLQVLLEGGVTRSYSIASAPTTQGLRQLELHIRHMPGGSFTDRVFSSLKVRDLLRVETPHGYFCLDEGSSKPMVMIASGTGFAPIKAIIEYSLQKNICRPLHLYWGGRRREDLYMHELASGWAAAHGHISYTPVLSDLGDAGESSGWQGRQGFVHQAVMQDYPNLSGHQVYACGAPVMVEAARRDFTSLCGLPQDQFLADSFVSEADRTREPANT
ncbi:MAG: CDP-6-deoxy-delta-3,4-glucoseen reductase [Pseudomonadota bacterium]